MKIKTKSNAILANSELFKKYDLAERWDKYSKIIPSKRGGRRESLSDAKNFVIRAIFDATFSNKNSLTESWRVAVALFDGCCYLCSEPMYDAQTGEVIENVEIQADHIIATHLGGTVSAGNVIAVHRECNNKKSNIDFETHLNDNPEQIRKIQDFQKHYSYSTSDIETVKKIRVLIEKNFDIFLTNTFRGIQEILRTSNLNK